MLPDVNLYSSRARKARYRRKIGNFGYKLLVIGLAAVLVGALALFVADEIQLMYFTLALGLFLLMFVLWYAYDLNSLKPAKTPEGLDGILSPSVLSRLKEPITPRSVAEVLKRDNQAVFIINHLLLPPQILDLLSQKIEDMPAVWQKAVELQAATKSQQLNGGTLLIALIMNNQQIMDFCQGINLTQDDLMEAHAWMARLVDYAQSPKPYFGGIGRDWAAGFTPLLDKFGANISQQIEKSGGFLHFLSDHDLQSGIVHSLNNGSGVAILGEPGSGKTTMVYALAQRLLEGKDEELHHYQVISLNASLIISMGGNRLEELLLRLFGEASRSGNKIIFLDDAELFFGEGVGAFDMSQVLLPVLERRRTKLIAAFTPADFQRLKLRNSSLTNLFNPITLSNHSKQDVMKMLEDSALLIEGRTDSLISYGAVKEAYRLSDQYLSDQAFPGKGIDLLEAAAPYSENRIVTDKSIQTALEKTRGVKAGGADQAESETLLNLESLLHTRMINQSRAVKVVSSALRRARAGVSGTDKPIGSFLFLGPTGVGKTELARSLAAVYFNDESRMIRLDMSEFQQTSDVSRILDAGEAGSNSLIIAIRQQPFSVVLLDEVEKAHPNVLNLLLQLLDEGKLTDINGKPASFKNAIIIATSNAGAKDISHQIAEGKALEEFEDLFVKKIIKDNYFKPELINRFDEIVLFRPLNQEELTKVAGLMLAAVNKTLSEQNITVELTQRAIQALVEAGYDPQFGARPMKRVLQKTVEDTVAQKILKKQASPGSTIYLDEPDLLLSGKQ